MAQKQSDYVEYNKSKEYGYGQEDEEDDGWEEEDGDQVMQGNMENEVMVKNGSYEEPDSNFTFRIYTTEEVQKLLPKRI